MHFLFFFFHTSSKLSPVKWFASIRFCCGKIFPEKIKISLLDPTLLFVPFLCVCGGVQTFLDRHIFALFLSTRASSLRLTSLLPWVFFSSGNQSHFTNKILTSKWCISSFYSDIIFNLKKYFPFSQYPYSYLWLSINAFIFFLSFLWVFLYFSPCDHHLLGYVLTCIIFWTVLIQEKQDNLTKGHVPRMLICMPMFIVLWRIFILMLQIPAIILVFLCAYS